MNADAHRLEMGEIDSRLRWRRRWTLCAVDARVVERFRDQFEGELPQ